MSKNAGANALGFAKPSFGLFSVPPMNIAMTFPEADRFQAQPSPAEKERAQESLPPLQDVQPAKPGADGKEQVGVHGLAAQPNSAAATSADLDRMSVQAALAGDHAAFADLVTRYQSAVYNMAVRMLGDYTEAEDAAQEVFVRAWNQLHTFQIDRRFSTWLLSIASHYCIDLLRRRRPTSQLDEVALYVESDDPAPDEIALAGEQRELVKRLLDTLPNKYRSVTVLRYYNDLSYDEIARMTGLTESAVKTQLHRARRMLAEQLLAKGGAPHVVPDNLR